MEDELEDHKFLYEQLRITKDNSIKFLLIETSKLPLATTGIFFPLFDYKKKQIQEGEKRKRQHGFIYNVVPLRDKSYILISTVTPFAASVNNQVHKDFLISVNELCNNEAAVINYLFPYFFYNNDSIALNPEWFEGLSDNAKNDLTYLMNYQVGRYSKTLIYDASQISHFSKELDIKIRNVNLMID